MPGQNAASRLLALCEKALQIPPGQNKSVSAGLEQLFGICDPEQFRQQARRLEDVLSEVDLAVDGLRRLDIPRALFEHEMQCIKSAFGHQAMHTQYQHVHNALGPGVIVALRWSAHVLEDEVGIRDPAEVALLGESLTELLAAVRASALPGTLRDFLERHLNALLDALRAEPIRGAAPLQSAVKAMAMDVVARDESLRQAEGATDEEGRSLLKRFGNAAKQALEVASTAGKGAEGLDKIWKFASERGPQLLAWSRELADKVN